MFNIPPEVRKQLLRCPHCGIEGFTLLGLALHRCTALPPQGIPPQCSLSDLPRPRKPGFTPPTSTRPQS